MNYYEQEFTSSLAGGNFYFGCFRAVGGDTESPCLNVGGLDVGLGPFANSYAQSDETEVLGYFGSIDFDITDNLTFTLEGRRQNDTLTKGGASTKDGLGEGSTELEFNKTLPRAIIRWQPFDSTMVYASYAEGIVPGDINIELVNADEQELAQYVAAFPTLGLLRYPSKKSRPLSWAGSRHSLMAPPISTLLFTSPSGRVSRGARASPSTKPAHQRTSRRVHRVVPTTA